jgi:hypothetical protein
MAVQHVICMKCHRHSLDLRRDAQAKEADNVKHVGMKFEIDSGLLAANIVCGARSSAENSTARSHDAATQSRQSDIACSCSQKAGRRLPCRNI